MSTDGGRYERTMKFGFRASVAVRLAAVLFGTLLPGGLAMATEGLTVMPSDFGAAETVDRLTAEISGRGMTVFARIDHSAGADAAGLQLRPTELLIFGSAKAGTVLMQADQATGIDLPLKVLVYQDATGKVWLAYNDPHWLAKRHGLGPAVQPTVDAMASTLSAIAMKAVKSPRPD